MCIVSFVGDYYKDKWPWIKPYIDPNIQPDPFRFPDKYPDMVPQPKISEWFKPQVSKEDFDNLKKEVEEMKKLLIRAKEYDEKNDMPDCEIEDKIRILREVARLVGVDLDDVLKKKDAE